MFNMNLTTNDVLFIYGLSIAKLYVNIALFMCLFTYIYIYVYIYMYIMCI